MAASEKIQGIRQFVSNFPLQDILETAEIVAGFVPVPGLVPVIKVLKTAIKFVPVADKALDTSAKIASNIETAKNAGADAAREKFNSLLEIAMADGTITEEEQEFLHAKAREVGISDDEFEMIIISKK